MPPEDGEPNDPDEGPVLSPDDLEITDDDNVTEIDEDRYVISPGGASPSPTPADDPPSPDTSAEPDLTDEAVEAWLAEKFGTADAHYGFHITGKFDDGVHHHTLMTNDVVTAFENLVRWYARHAGGDTPIEEVLGILLSESSTPVEFPPSAMRSLVAAHDLDRSDSIGQLLDSIDRQGLSFPR